ncbi:hypothetical protein MKX03_034015 [Papaver bracteatum]|nr:hypothetical protein MKX03_034015 [Papaver bracteatum]
MPDNLGVYPSYEKPGVYPHHLQRFTEQIESLEECVDETMAFGELAKHLIGMSSWIGIILLVGSARERFSNQKMKVTLYQLLWTRLLCLWVMFLQLLLKTWQIIPIRTRFRHTVLSRAERKRENGSLIPGICGNIWHPFSDVFVQ